MKKDPKQHFKPIDIKKVFYEKNPQIAKWIPGFVFRYLKRITHEKLLNKIIEDYGHLKSLEFSKALINEFNISVEVKGEENLPKEGRHIFVSNHPLGGMDGHIIMLLIGDRYGSYKFLVNDILMALTNMHDVFIPVNKHGRQGIELAEKLDTAFKSDAQIISFPAGIVSRRIKGQIIDLEWQKSFINKARQYKRDVIPIHISGTNSKFFYSLANLRNKLGIKANIEMLYLINEAVKNRNKTHTVTFGEPISWESFNTSKRPIAWAKWVKEKVYKLGNK